MPVNIARYHTSMIDTMTLAIGLATLLYMLHLLSLGLAAFQCRPLRGSTHALSDSGVTLVRPLCGVESHSALTLRSSFLQNLTHFEVLFCVARESDAVVPLVHQLMAEHPNVRARLLIGEDHLGQNPKLNNMAKGWREARYTTVVFTDSNLLITPDYCARILNAFGPDVGMVSSPPIGSHAEGFWGEVECAMLNTHAARLQYAASALGLRFAQGKTLAFQKGVHTTTLMQDLASEPAEDAAATKLMRRMKKSVRLIGPPFQQPLGPRTLKAVWSRHIRWARLRRSTFPLLFSIELFAGICAPLAASTYAASEAGFTPALALLLMPLLWYGPEYALARYAGWHFSARSLPAWMVRDMMLPAFYVAAWLSTDFVWRGHQMNGAKETRISTT